MPKALEGIKVLDFSRFIAGPYAAMFLADMGAEVIRVEKSEGAEDRYIGELMPNGMYLAHTVTMGRNKKSLTLNLRAPKAEAILRGLVAKADVCIHNYPVGTPESAILAYERLSAWNPRVIVAAISGFGQTGPYARRSAFDSVAQAISGMMSFNGFPDSPPLRTGIPAVDWGTALHALAGILTALYWRTQSGHGQLVDVSMLDAAVSCVAASIPPADYRTLGMVRKPRGNTPAHSFGGCFPSADGWFYLAVIGNRLWRRFAKAIGRPELAEDPRLADDGLRARNHEAIGKALTAWSSTKPTAEIVRILDAAKIPLGWVNDIPAMMADPQIAAREMLLDMDLPGGLRTTVPGISIKLSATPGQIERGLADLGEQNAEIYGEWLGLSAEEIAALKQEGTI